ncbi:hypothetical protein MYIN104542_17110 [Mycobacterium intermedium]
MNRDQLFRLFRGSIGKTRGDRSRARATDSGSVCTSVTMPPTSKGMGTVTGGCPANGPPNVTVAVMGWIGASRPPKGMLSATDTPAMFDGNGMDIVFWP